MLRYLVHQFRKPRQCSALFRIDCTRCVFRDCVSFFFSFKLCGIFLFMVRIAITAQTNTLQKNLKNRRVQTYQSVYMLKFDLLKYGSIFFFSQDVAVFAIWICLCWYSSLDIWHFFFSSPCVFRIYRWFNSSLHYNFKAEFYYLTSCFVQLVCFLSALCSVLILIVIFA